MHPVKALHFFNSNEMETIIVIERSAHGHLVTYDLRIEQGQWQELWAEDDDSRTHLAREKGYIPKKAAIYAMRRTMMPKTKRQYRERTKDLVETYEL